MMFWSSGVIPGASRPMLAVIRPNSSNVAEFISSWMPLGSILTASWGPFPSLRGPRVSNLKKLPPCSLMRISPSHFALGVGPLHQPLATKLVP